MAPPPFHLALYYNNYVITHFKKFHKMFYLHIGFRSGSNSQESSCNTEELDAIPMSPSHSLCLEDPLEKGMAAHSNIPAWRIPLDGGA